MAWIPLSNLASLKRTAIRKQDERDRAAAALYRAQINREANIAELQDAFVKAKKVAVLAANAVIEFETKHGVQERAFEGQGEVPSDGGEEPAPADCGRVPAVYG